MSRTEIERHGDAVIFRDDALAPYHKMPPCIPASEWPFPSSIHFGCVEDALWLTWEDERPTEGPFGTIDAARRAAEGDDQ